MQEAQSVVVEDLLLRDPREVLQLEVQLRGHLFVQEQFENIYTVIKDSKLPESIKYWQRLSLSQKLSTARQETSSFRLSKKLLGMSALTFN